jgi:3-hydroxyacyl-CoA dehydrogenase
LVRAPGAGIAQAAAASGMEVVLLDMKTEFVEAGLKRIAYGSTDVKKAE